MKIILFTLVLSASCYFLHGQNLKYPVTASYLQLKGYCSQTADPFGFTSNQAALASNKYISAGIYSEKRFLLADLSLYSAAIALPTASGNFGLCLNYLGNTFYNESMIGLAYARKLNNKTDIGIQFNYYEQKAASVGKITTINFEAGVLFHITSQLNAGFHIYNPTLSHAGNFEQLPFIYSMGLGYQTSQDVFLGCEIEKVENESIGLKAGIQYQFDKKLNAKCGVATATSAYYFGIGYFFYNIQLDVTASVHPYLGITPGLLLIFKAPQVH